MCYLWAPSCGRIWNLMWHLTLLSSVLLDITDVSLFCVLLFYIVFLINTKLHFLHLETEHCSVNNERAADLLNLIWQNMSHWHIQKHFTQSYKAVNLFTAFWIFSSICVESSLSCYNASVSANHNIRTKGASLNKVCTCSWIMSPFQLFTSSVEDL